MAEWEQPYWNKRAVSYGINAPGYSATGEGNDKLQALLDSKIGRHRTLLDFGCGTGRNYETLSRHCEWYYGIDYSPEMLNLFKANRKMRPQDAVSEIDASEHIPYMTGTFDAVVSNAVLQHIVDPAKLYRAIREIKRVLRPGGTLYIHEAILKGILVSQPYAYQRYRPKKTYVEMLLPEIPIQDKESPFSGMRFCSGVRKPDPEYEGVIVDLGCGRLKLDGSIGLDVRKISHYGRQIVDVLADVQVLPFKDNSVDQIYCENVLEHFKNPYPIILEIFRVLKKEGTVVFVVPYPGTHSGCGDDSHKFVTDGEHWVDIFGGFFAKVTIFPMGVYFSASSEMKEWQRDLIKKGMHGMTQGGRFVCTKPAQIPQINYVPWWLDEWVAENFGRDMI
jgi:ubiquinone/menaquinone biosynthesis C-methylase UbiE